MTQADWSGALPERWFLQAPPVEVGAQLHLRKTGAPPRASVRPKLSSFWEAPRPGSPGLGVQGAPRRIRARERDKLQGGGERGPAALLNDSTQQFHTNRPLGNELCTQRAVYDDSRLWV